MKKAIVIGIVFLFAMVGCHKKAMPAITDRTKQPAAPGKQETVYAIADINAGKPIYETKCAKCHGMKNIADFTPVRWAGILRGMIPKAKLNEEESRQVTAYVMVNAKKS